MIVTRGLGRGSNRGSIAAHGLTRRTRIERIVDALEFYTLAPRKAFKSAAHTMYSGIKTLIPSNGSTK